MSSLERPRLRPYLSAAQDQRDPRYVFIHDRLRLADGPRRVTLQEFGWVQMFDGRRSVFDIQSEAIRQSNGLLLPIELFTRLVEQFDEACFLDGPRFRDRLCDPIRKPSCIGCYEAEPDALRRQVTELFKAGPGLPQTTTDGTLHAALIPHIDYARGGVSFAWGFKEVFERTDASLFVIIGTSHYSAERFTLTRKNFMTPLGVVPTDQEYIERLVKHYGDGTALFKDEITHLPEHSIELEVVFLQYLYEGERPIRIVPLVVGSFEDCVQEVRDPWSAPDIARMIEALRRTEAETPEPICYIISGDLAHIGPKFGDREAVTAAQVSHSRQQDAAILKMATAADPNGYFRVIAAERDRRRICGLPPTYTLLEAIRPARAKMIHYDQYVHPRGFESVSFASMAFYR